MTGNIDEAPGPLVLVQQLGASESESGGVLCLGPGFVCFYRAQLKGPEAAPPRSFGRARTRPSSPNLASPAFKLSWRSHQTSTKGLGRPGPSSLSTYGQKGAGRPRAGLRPTPHTESPRKPCTSTEQAQSTNKPRATCVYLAKAASGLLHDGSSLGSTKNSITGGLGGTLGVGGFHTQNLLLSLQPN